MTGRNSKSVQRTESAKSAANRRAMAAAVRELERAEEVSAVISGRQYDTRSPATRALEGLEALPSGAGATLRNARSTKAPVGAIKVYKAPKAPKAPRIVNPDGPVILQVWGSGATGVLHSVGARVVHVNDAHEIAANIGRAVGIVLTGGGDVNPERYGAKRTGKEYGISATRDALEFDLVRWALKLKLPILGICRGNQVLNVALGGTLVQDLPTAGKTGHGNGLHAVSVDPKSRLGRTVGDFLPEVTTLHHQAVKRVGRGMRAVAWAADGTIEATESVSASLPAILGVQFHPEMDYYAPKGEGDYARDVFAAFIEATKVGR